MKQIIKPAQKEEFKYICDVCKQEEAVSWLRFLGGYGSTFDMTSYRLDLCRTCGDRCLGHLQNIYKESLIEKELSILDNPWDD